MTPYGVLPARLSGSNICTLLIWTEKSICLSLPHPHSVLTETARGARESGRQEVKIPRLGINGRLYQHVTLDADDPLLTLERSAGRRLWCIDPTGSRHMMPSEWLKSCEEETRSWIPPPAECSSNAAIVFWWDLL
ncbi:unnamed protein product [Protopolystoma xenopodis]|uniref:Uncharacterized protein n=1 Tax=Protopolystoma xenopodis TaxID=117903 RepID=A0A3S4ZGF3_9PLAT|nr:unnamed protein product [Protopolystoma xenopodis]